ncbi:hypothetical protein BKA63DRAFT_486913 [Paraphoma chrysanthemicola]|nr:hypothetical protein BKA63DRAFT_486913 [Paraphoma chrysanthemicola]
MGPSAPADQTWHQARPSQALRHQSSRALPPPKKRLHHETLQRRRTARQKRCTPPTASETSARAQPAARFEPQPPMASHCASRSRYARLLYSASYARPRVAALPAISSRLSFGRPAGLAQGAVRARAANPIRCDAPSSRACSHLDRSQVRVPARPTIPMIAKLRCRILVRGRNLPPGTATAIHPPIPPLPPHQTCSPLAHAALLPRKWVHGHTAAVDRLTFRHHESSHGRRSSLCRQAHHSRAMAQGLSIHCGVATAPRREIGFTARLALSASPALPMPHTETRVAVVASEAPAASAAASSQRRRCARLNKDCWTIVLPWSIPQRGQARHTRKLLWLFFVERHFGPRLRRSQTHPPTVSTAAYICRTLKFAGGTRSIEVVAWSENYAAVLSNQRKRRRKLLPFVGRRAALHSLFDTQGRPTPRVRVVARRTKHESLMCPLQGHVRLCTQPNVGEGSVLQVVHGMGTGMHRPYD